MRILLVEDHVQLSRWIARALEGSRLEVERAMNGADADAMLASTAYDLVILDLTLARMDGLEVLRRLRGRGSDTPVLIVTARNDVEDRVRGLDLGADDYLAKPFELAELEARVRALLRRASGRRQPLVRCGGLEFDSIGRTFSLDGRRLALTPREHAVLESLILRAGRAVAREQLFERLYAVHSDKSPDAIEVYVHRIRRKLEGSAVRITTLRGLGYLLEQPTA